MKKPVLFLLFLIFICISITFSTSSNENCLESVEFPICLYPEKNIEFIVYRNGKEVGWHKVTFEKSGDLVIAETKAFVKAPYLLIFDYIMEYYSISTWSHGKLLKLNASLNDDGDEYTISIEKNSDGKIVIQGKENSYIIEDDTILPTEHWHPKEINSSTLISTLDGEIVNVSSTQIDEKTWFIDGDIKYYINYDNNMRWTGLQFRADEDEIIEYICDNCN